MRLHAHWRNLIRRTIRLLQRSPSLLLRFFRKRALRAAYAGGAARAQRKELSEPCSQEIVELGRSLRARLLESYAEKHRSDSFRVLMLRPPSMTAEVWFGGLDASFRHAGVHSRVLPHAATAREINECIDAFRPNVLIAVETTTTLQAIDLEYIRKYKLSAGCLRLFVPVVRSGMPGGVSTPGDDKLRRKLSQKGLLADAHFSIFEPEFHERFEKDPRRPRLDCRTIPQACNPFCDYPVAEDKVLDYFQAAMISDDRLEVCYRYVRPILRKYHGMWAGPGWGFGRPMIPPAEMAEHYGRARIALSPLVTFVTRYSAELTHRVYAAAACGAFQITTATSVADRYFESNELVQASSPAEFVAQFEHYVSRPGERNAIALKALRRAWEQHTCLHRVDEFVSYWRDLRKRGLF